MKTMTKIKLINWHIFNNHTISIENNTLVTGENGHGKSTLLDAVNFVLSGATSKFNQAANTNSKRTVESYVRGKLGIEGKTSLREQTNVTAYIALEFYDSLTKKHFIIGTIFELPLRKNHGVFYHIKDTRIEDDYFLRENKILGLSQFKAMLKASGSEVKTFDTKRDIKNMIKSTLGLASDKYFELLPKALAFSPINEVSKFVYDFLLPEDFIDIDGLKSNIHSYREISKLLNIEKEKLLMLTPIEDFAKQYKELQDNIQILDALLSTVKIEEVESNILKEEKKAIDANKNEIDFTQNKDKIDKQLIDIENSIEELEKSDVTKRVKKLESELSQSKIDQKIHQDKIAEVNTLLKHEKGIADSLNLQFQALKDAQNTDYPQLIKHIGDFDEDINELNKKTIIELSDINKLNSHLLTKKLDLDQVIKNLESNKFNYDDRVTQLIKTIKEEFYNSYNGFEIEIKPLCELLEIDPENEPWRNAIEGYLNTQRFDLIVDPKYFNQALEFYEKHKFSKKIYGVGLVNTNKLKDYQVKEGSLATKVKGLNEFARQTIIMIMGGVVCVDDISELKEHKQSITQTCMTYKNNTARQINEKIWLRPYIGIEAIKIQLENAYKKAKHLQEEINLNKTRKDELNKILSIIKNSRLKELFNMPNYYEELDNVIIRINNISGELELLKTEHAWLEVADLLQNKKLEKKELNEKRDVLIGNIKLEEDKYIKSINKAEQLRGELSDLREDFELPDISDYLERLDRKKANLMKQFSGSYSKIKLKIAELLITSGKSLNKLEVNINKLMNDYITKYDNGQLIADIKNLNDFTQLLSKIKIRNIIEYEDRAVLALEKCEKSFKEDFLSKLREKIRSAEGDFIRLNKALKSKPFGSEEEIYAFICIGSLHPDFKDYYPILKSYEDYESKSLFIETLSEKNLILLKTLFDTLTAMDTTEAQTRRIQEFTDYRKYMSYDIKITNNKEEVLFFSKVNKEKSGGETQTPFYVIIASSFQQILESSRKNRSSACVVMFDEAFNNMDEARIEAMMEYYNELNIQLLIAVPPQRVINIIPYVETTLGIIKSNNTVYVSRYKNIISED